MIHTRYCGLRTFAQDRRVPVTRAGLPAGPRGALCAGQTQKEGDTRRCPARIPSTPATIPAGPVPDATTCHAPKPKAVDTCAPPSAARAKIDPVTDSMCSPRSRVHVTAPHGSPGTTSDGTRTPQRQQVMAATRARRGLRASIKTLGEQGRSATASLRRQRRATCTRTGTNRTALLGHRRRRPPGAGRSGSRRALRAAPVRGSRGGQRCQTKPDRVRGTFNTTHRNNHGRWQPSRRWKRAQTITSPRRAPNREAARRASPGVGTRPRIVWARCRRTRRGPSRRTEPRRSTNDRPCASRAREGQHGRPAEQPQGQPPVARSGAWVKQAVTGRQPRSLPPAQSSVEDQEDKVAIAYVAVARHLPGRGGRRDGLVRSSTTTSGRSRGRTQSAPVAPAIQEVVVAAGSERCRSGRPGRRSASRTRSPPNSRRYPLTLYGLEHARSGAQPCSDWRCGPGVLRGSPAAAGARRSPATPRHRQGGAEQSGRGTVAVVPHRRQGRRPAAAATSGAEQEARDDGVAGKAISPNTVTTTANDQRA